MLSIKAASSIRSRDTASDLAASALDDLAVIFDPLVNRKLSLFFSKDPTFSQDGKFSYINCTFVTRFLAVACVVARVNTFLSLWKVISHKEYPAANVEIPSCLDFKIIE
jgi:hypothetical protein